MKKFVSGVIVGALLFAGVSVYADSVGLVGKKVAGTYAVVKDGKKIADAAIIDGSAYAPVRAVSQAAGTSLTLEGKKIIMSDTTSMAVAESAVTPTQKTLADLQAERDKVNAAIREHESVIKEYESYEIPRYEELVKTNQPTETVRVYQDALDKSKEKVQTLKTELAELQAQLTAIDAQITALQK